jgi:hypothetical protein
LWIRTDVLHDGSGDLRQTEALDFSQLLRSGIFHTFGTPARGYIGGEFWPESFEGLWKEIDMTGDKNRWFCQVYGYWEMAAALAVYGAVDEDLFVAMQIEMVLSSIECDPLPLVMQVRTVFKTSQPESARPLWKSGHDREPEKASGRNLAHAWHTGPNWIYGLNELCKVRLL